MQVEISKYIQQPEGFNKFKIVVRNWIREMRSTGRGEHLFTNLEGTAQYMTVFLNKRLTAVDVEYMLNIVLEERQRTSELVARRPLSFFERV